MRGRVHALTLWSSHLDRLAPGETFCDMIYKNVVLLPVGSLSVTPDQMSVNQNLRKELDLFASLVKCRSIPGISTRHKDVDIGRFTFFPFFLAFSFIFVKLILIYP